MQQESGYSWLAGEITEKEASIRSLTNQLLGYLRPTEEPDWSTGIRERELQSYLKAPDWSEYVTLSSHG